MAELLLKYEMLDDSGKAKLLDYLEFLLSKMPKKRKSRRSGGPAQPEKPGPEGMVSEADLAYFARPIRENITVEELMAEQHFTVFDREGFDRLAQKIDIQEPIEVLLAQLTP